MSKIRARQRGARHVRRIARRGRPGSRTRVIILGAGGRDFHNFNVYFRGRPEYQVVAFTATQIPDLEGRLYPPVLAGPLYPAGIPIYAEEELAELVRRLRADQVVFAYSDVSHEHVMHVASIAMAAGASFMLLGPAATMLVARVPVVSICAVRTGAGKSQTTRRVTGILKALGRRIAVIRHPMAYGELARQRVQRFGTLEDLDRYDVTIEEREEYEPHIAAGTVVYAGVDYQEVVRQAQREADIIVWDGGNNDFPFLRSNLHIVIADPHRPGHEVTYHPGETNLRMADLVDPRPYAVGSIRQVFAAYPHLGSVLPAMGYGAQQTKELQETIAASDCDLVVIGTPVDLRRVITIRKPAVRVWYELQEITKPDLEDILKQWWAEQK